MHEGAVVGFRTVVQEVEATQFLLGLHFISHILVVTIQWSLERGLKQIFYMKLYIDTKLPTFCLTAVESPSLISITVPDSTAASDSGNVSSRWENAAIFSGKLSIPNS